MRTSSEIASLMLRNPKNSAIQVHQTEFRARLVKHWGITEGARILEIGCGQGDTTAVLADAVGPSGHITAVDFAGPAYGAPTTLGESTDHLLNGPLGDRIDFRFDFDVLDPVHSFPADTFDFVVLAHCTWYFDSLTKVRKTLKRIRPWAPLLCLSEWDLQARSIDQLGHLLAVLIQGQVEAIKPASQSNVRTPYSLESLHKLLEESGWAASSVETIDTHELEDAKWEIDICLGNSLIEAEEMNCPEKLQSLLVSQTDVLRRLAKTQDLTPLHAYALLAHRSEPI